MTKSNNNITAQCARCEHPLGTREWQGKTYPSYVSVIVGMSKNGAPISKPMHPECAAKVQAERAGAHLAERVC